MDISDIKYVNPDRDTITYANSAPITYSYTDADGHTYTFTIPGSVTIAYPDRQFKPDPDRLPLPDGGVPGG
jgi:hypothetical protein